MNQALNSELLFSDVGQNVGNDLSAISRLTQRLANVRTVPLFSATTNRSGATNSGYPEGAGATRRTARVDLPLRPRSAGQVAHVRTFPGESDCAGLRSFGTPALHRRRQLPRHSPRHRGLTLPTTIP